MCVVGGGEGRQKKLIIFLYENEETMLLVVVMLFLCVSCLLSSINIFGSFSDFLIYLCLVNLIC